MQIDAILYQLLLKHECIIVPNFGGFIVRESPCNFNASKDVLKPYIKSVFFNPHLNENDGLMINAIMSSEKISYNEANNLLEKWVKSQQDSLFENGKSIIKGIGVFNKGNDNSKWFSSDPALNLELSTFGLRPVKAAIVNSSAVAEEVHEIVYKPLADNKPIESLDIPKTSWKAWAAAAAIALVAHIGYLTFETSDRKVNEASVATTLSAENVKPAETVVETAPEETAPETAITEETVVPETETVIPEPTQEAPVVEPKADIIPETPTVIKETPASEPVATEETVAVPAIKVMGKYKLEQNAIYHQKDLAKQGLVAEVRLNDKGLFEVIVSDAVAY